jgi:hypothetical protein
MTTTTPTLKRSMKRLATAAAENGWTVEVIRSDDYVVELSMTLPPDETVPEPAPNDYPSRRFLNVAEVRVSGSPETGAWFGATAFDGSGGFPGTLGLDTVGDVERLLRFRTRWVAEREAAEIAKAAASERAAERRAIREAYVEALDGDYRYESVKEIASTGVEPPTIDPTWLSYRVTGAMTSYLTVVLAAKMAATALDMVGWPEERYDGRRAEPISLGAALGKAVAEVIGRESTSGADFKALTEAAKAVLRYA